MSPIRSLRSAAFDCPNTVRGRTTAGNADAARRRNSLREGRGIWAEGYSRAGRAGRAGRRFRLSSQAGGAGTAGRPYNRGVDLLNALTGTLPFAFTSGVNLYATVAVLGLCSHFGFVALPDQFRALDNPWVIGIAAVMYAVEFVADKVPWLDTAWDAVHTVIRPLGGALVAISALGNAGPGLQAAAALLGGSVAMTTHLTKAGTRAVVNMSP